ncbi:MAG: cytochrome P450 [Deltaproteobacteria bacterium]
MAELAETRTIDLLDRDFYSGDPDPTYAWMRANAPVYWDEKNQLWGVSRYDDVVEVSRNADIYSSAQGARPNTPPDSSMINQDDPQHNLQRRLVNKGMTPQMVAKLESDMRAVVSEIIDRVAGRGECEFVKEVAVPLPMRMIAELLGVPPEDEDRLQHWSDTMIGGADGPQYITEEVNNAFLEFVEYQQAIIAERLAEPRDDFISKIVHAEIDGKSFELGEQIAESLLLLVGGNETTRNVISGSMLALMRHPDQRQALIDDPSKLPLAIEEFVRWVTPILNFRRTVTRDTVLGGQQLRQGDNVLIMYSSANRDEAIFDEPHKFDITRDPNPHIAFGQGRHFCLGANLARLEIRVIFEELLRRLPDIRLADGAEIAYSNSAFIRGVKSMPVVFTPEQA